MLVRGDGIEGTIGGGALEWEAMRIARQMLADGVAHAEAKMPLGPALGQCCGGRGGAAFEAAEAVGGPRGADLWSGARGMWGGQSSPRWPPAPRGDHMGRYRPGAVSPRTCPTASRRWPPPTCRG